MTRLLVLDSSFNPPTIAHKLLIQQAQARLPRPAKPVLLLATKNADKVMSDVPHRLAMMQLMAAGMEGCQCLTTPHARFIDKIKDLLQQQQQQQQDDGEVYFIMGYDTIVRVLDKRYYGNDEYESSMKQLFSLARIIVFTRDAQAEQMKDLERSSPWAQAMELVVESHIPNGVSSTAVRDAVHHANWSKAIDMCDAAIVEYIKKHGLYAQ